MDVGTRVSGAAPGLFKGVALLLVALLVAATAMASTAGCTSSDRQGWRIDRLCR